ncbi:hypothetical protein [Burkholderia cepacia]|uniref:hypothetical protein n=1 Tax=Burkholderia cepacia TaxID=292 RepID=UPI00075C1ABD|nr:hypothetical protein [Burkholderia cepacia]KWI49503.1 hypothetical protein WM06_19995 [Burkholderia cepacia]UQO38165.1 hypothetical protein L0Z22_21115 [Burkholderia cepacia]UQO52503.1 hypothetical protein L0Z05_27245 [Burkholderia cepacia]UQP06648.1 hypothetical protein L0Z01_04065 [Burkholderia cepacia]
METQLPNIIKIAFDRWTLRQGWVDHELYEKELRAALPNHELQFSFAPDIPQSVGMKFAFNVASGADAAMAFEAAKQVWPNVINTAMTIAITEPDVVTVLGEQIRVGHVTVWKNENGTWTLARVREIYKVADNTVTFGLGPIGHTMRTVLKEDKVVVTKESATSTGS